MKDTEVTSRNVLAWNKDLQRLVVLPEGGAEMNEDVLECAQNIGWYQTFFGDIRPDLSNVSPVLKTYLSGVSKSAHADLSLDRKLVRFRWTHQMRQSEWGGEQHVSESPDGYRGATTLGGYRVEHTWTETDYISAWVPFDDEHETGAFPLMMCGVKFYRAMDYGRYGLNWFAGRVGPHPAPDGGLLLSIAFIVDALPEACFPHDVSREEFKMYQSEKASRRRMDYDFLWNEQEQAYLLVPQDQEQFRAYCDDARAQFSRIKVEDRYVFFPVIELKTEHGAAASQSSSPLSRAVAMVNGTPFSVKRSVERDGTYKYWEVDSSRWQKEQEEMHAHGY